MKKLSSYYPKSPWFPVGILIAIVIFTALYLKIPGKSSGSNEALVMESQTELLKMTEEFKNEKKPQRSGRLITGQIFDTSDFFPIPGAIVMGKDQTRGTTTDAQGRFQLDLGPETENLIIEFAGFSSKEVAVDERANYVVGLSQMTGSK